MNKNSVYPFPRPLFERSTESSKKASHPKEASEKAELSEAGERSQNYKIAV
ncbi:hypothetical protein [Mariprofundus sp. KV]|uniref:hypothetical protein n=1 Tax=Mariprofundus sp. KV TaxID=2608715 RepID=UPI0015A2C95D|nr:hypothetical protein [Mariprofundus sp. KV]